MTDTQAIANANQGNGTVKNHWLGIRLQRILRAGFYSWTGLRHALRERPFQEELAVLLLLAIPGAVCFGHGGLERALLIGSWANVLVIEVLNSAIEAAIDRIGVERHPLSGMAKDLGSLAVLLGILIALAVWGLVLFG